MSRSFLLNWILIISMSKYINTQPHILFCNRLPLFRKQSWGTWDMRWVHSAEESIVGLEWGLHLRGACCKWGPWCPGVNRVTEVVPPSIPLYTLFSPLVILLVLSVFLNSTHSSLNSSLTFSEQPSPTIPAKSDCSFLLVKSHSSLTAHAQAAQSRSCLFQGSIRNVYTSV